MKAGFSKLTASTTTVLILFLFFTTCKKKTPSELPEVTTSAITKISSTHAYSGGTIAVKGLDILSRGVCWSTHSNPTVADNKTTDDIGTGSFVSYLHNLYPATVYYVRAYASNSAGIGYGSELSFTTLQPLKGDIYQGGIVTYLLQPGDLGYDATTVHGIIAALSDCASQVAWWNGSYVVTGATSTAIGTGNTNTNLIVAMQGVGLSAAVNCWDLVWNGYNDWYLPSKEELQILYWNRVFIGGFKDEGYWSSTEGDKETAGFLNFGISDFVFLKKESKFNVRPIRSF